MNSEDEKWMEETYHIAQKAMDKGEVPVGCLIGTVNWIRLDCMDLHAACSSTYLIDRNQFTKEKLLDAEEIYRMKEKVRSNMLNSLPWKKLKYLLPKIALGLLHHFIKLCENILVHLHFSPNQHCMSH